MKQKKIEVLKLIDKANNSNYSEDFESLKKKDYEAGFLRVMKGEGLVFWDDSLTFHLTKEGEKILLGYSLMEDLTKSLKINKSFVKLITDQAKMREKIILPTINLQEIIPKLDYSKLVSKIDYSKLMPDYSRMFKGIFDAVGNLNLASAKKFQDKFPWLDFLSIGLGLKLGDVLEKESEKKVFEELFKVSCEEEFEEYFIVSLKNIPCLEKRLKIISEGYKQHKGKNFISSVSILSPQIEGIIWDIGVFEGVVQDEINSRKIIDKKGRVIYKIRNKNIEWDLKHLILHLFGNEDPQTKYYYEVLYSSLRSPIAHGRETDFDKLENSVTCLLLIMAMIEKIKEIN